MAVVGEAVIEEEDSEAGLHTDSAHIEATVEGMFPFTSLSSLLTFINQRTGKGILREWLVSCVKYVDSKLHSIRIL